MIGSILNAHATNCQLAIAFNPASGPGNGVPIPVGAQLAGGTDGKVTISQPDRSDDTKLGIERLYGLRQLLAAASSL